MAGWFGSQFAWLKVKTVLSLLLLKANIFILSDDVHGEVDSCKENRFAVIRKLSEGELKIGKIQVEVLRKDGGNGGVNNDGVGNGIGDIYKHDRQQLTISSNVFEINPYWDKRQERIVFWITWITGTKGQDVDKSWRQQIKIYFKWKKKTSSWSRGIRVTIQLSTDW